MHQISKHLFKSSLNSSKKILSPSYNKSNYIFNNLTPKYNLSSTSFAGYTQRVYQKVNITRLPHQNFTIYIDLNDKVQTLFKHLNKMFPKSKFIATNKFQNKIGFPITEQDNLVNQQIQNLQLIQLLIHTNLLVYEQNNNTHSLCIGIQLKQYHQTNNRNLPQHIASNILQLAEQWRTDRSVEYALSKVQTYNQAQHKQYIQQKQQLAIQAKDSYNNYLQLCRFYKKQFFQNGKARSLMANLIALMSVNWIFLFGITYGKYGWDVGQPLSYLTVLAVELIAMLGIFSMNDVVQRSGRQDWRAIVTKMNLQSLLKARQFLIAYSKRHF